MYACTHTYAYMGIHAHTDTRAHTQTHTDTYTHAIVLFSVYLGSPDSGPVDEEHQPGAGLNY